MKTTAKIIMLSFIILLIMSSSFVFAEDGSTGSLTAVVVNVSDEQVAVGITDYALAYTAGRGNPLFDYLAAGKNSINLSAVASGSKYLNITQYALNYTAYGSMTGAIANTPALSQATIQNYKKLVRMDGSTPVLEPLFDNNIVRVTFLDWNGAQLTSYGLTKGSTAYIREKPQRKGYTFSGWDKPLANIMVDTTFNAQYIINQYTVAFESSGGSSVVNQTINYNSPAAQPTAPTKGGYIFGGWYIDSSLSNPYDFNTPIVQDITLYAKWNLSDNTITLGGKVLNAATPYLKNNGVPDNNSAGYNAYFNAAANTLTLSDYNGNRLEWSGDSDLTIIINNSAKINEGGIRHLSGGGKLILQKGSSSGSHAVLSIDNGFIHSENGSLSVNNGVDLRINITSEAGPVYGITADGGAKIYGNAKVKLDLKGIDDIYGINTSTGMLEIVETSQVTVKATSKSKTKPVYGVTGNSRIETKGMVRVDTFGGKGQAFNREPMINSNNYRILGSYNAVNVNYLHNDNALQSISVLEKPAKEIYYYRENKLDLTGLKAYLSWTNAGEEVDFSEFAARGITCNHEQGASLATLENLGNWEYVSDLRVRMTHNGVEKISSDVRIFAVSTDLCKVTFETSGGTPEPEMQLVDIGQKATRPAIDPTIPNLTFLGWKRGNNTFNFNTDTITDHTVIYAGWEGSMDGEIIIDGYKKLNFAKPYLRNDEQPTADPTGYNVYYDVPNNTLTLNNYIGDGQYKSYAIGSYNARHLKIILNGDNVINMGGMDIRSSVTFEGNGSLTLKNGRLFSSRNINIMGGNININIDEIYGDIYSETIGIVGHSGKITITGDHTKVKVNVTGSKESLKGIWAGGMSVEGNSSLEVNVTCNGDVQNNIGIYASEYIDIMITTLDRVSINVGGDGRGKAINSENIIINEESYSIKGDRYGSSVVYIRNNDIEPLRFENRNLDISPGKPGKGINSIDLNIGVSGGTGPYTFTKVGVWPEWLNLSSEGIITGTRPSETKPRSLIKVKVTDSLGANKTISLEVGNVYEHWIKLGDKYLFANVEDGYLKNDGSYGNAGNYNAYFRKVKYGSQQEKVELTLRNYEREGDIYCGSEIPLIIDVVGHNKLINGRIESSDHMELEGYGWLDVPFGIIIDPRSTQGKNITIDGPKIKIHHIVSNSSVTGSYGIEAGSQGKVEIYGSTEVDMHKIFVSSYGIWGGEGVTIGGNSKVKIRFNGDVNILKASGIYVGEGELNIHTLDEIYIDATHPNIKSYWAINAREGVVMNFNSINYDSTPCPGEEEYPHYADQYFHQIYTNEADPKYDITVNNIYTPDQKPVAYASKDKSVEYEHIYLNTLPGYVVTNWDPDNWYGSIMSKDSKGRDRLLMPNEGININLEYGEHIFATIGVDKMGINANNWNVTTHEWDNPNAILTYTTTENLVGITIAKKNGSIEGSIKSIRAYYFDEWRQKYINTTVYKGTIQAVAPGVPLTPGLYTFEMPEYPVMIEVIFE